MRFDINKPCVAGLKTSEITSPCAKAADEWEAIINTGRVKRKHQNQKQKEELREIQKQENPYMPG